MTSLSTAQAPLLSLTDFRTSEEHLRADHFRTTGRGLCLVGRAQGLLSALLHPEQNSGEVLLLGRAPELAMRQGQAGYAPAKLPLNEKVRVCDALLISGQLIGASKGDVTEVLSRCQIEALAKKKLGSLSPLQQRLAGLAHGLLMDPPLLILEDLLADLEEEETDVLEGILEGELVDRAFIVGTSLKSAAGRRLMMLADEVLFAEGGEIMASQEPNEVSADAYWVVCLDDATALTGRIKEVGARVTQGPTGRALLVRGASGSQILKCSLEAEVVVSQISPLLTPAR